MDKYFIDSTGAKYIIPKKEVKPGSLKILKELHDLLSIRRLYCYGIGMCHYTNGDVIYCGDCIYCTDSYDAFTEWYSMKMRKEKLERILNEKN